MLFDRLRRFGRDIRRFARDRRGNVAMIFGLASVPLIFATGWAVDYGNNMRKWSAMNAAADAAALAGVTPAMMLQSNSSAQTVATNMFNAQVKSISNATITKLTVTPSTNGVQRVMTVDYTASLTNVFGGVLGQQAMVVSGHAVANGSPANMNFYLLLDTSPSMEIAGTSSGITTMLQNTTYQQSGSSWGCAFACHESNPPACSNASAPNAPSSQYTGTKNTDVCGNPQGTKNTPYYSVSGGTVSNTNPKTGIDNYQLARNLGITLRIDMVGTAAQGMVQAAQSELATDLSNFGTEPTYQIAVYSFDSALHNLFPLTSNLSSLNSSLSASPSPIQPLEVYQENTDCTTSACTAGVASDDQDTNIDAALNALNTSSSSTYIPNPTTANAGEVLLIVTDGVEDEKVSSITAGLNDPYDSTRQQSAMFANATTPSYQQCQAIKARGISVAVLYTAYVPLDSGSVSSWYDTFLYPFQSGSQGDQIQTALQSCASPSLFLTVQASDDVNAIKNALVQLFMLAQSPHLTQ
jgi:Flp pilus assembly protein TadG